MRHDQMPMPLGFIASGCDTLRGRHGDQAKIHETGRDGRADGRTDDSGQHTTPFGCYDMIKSRPISDNTALEPESSLTLQRTPTRRAWVDDGSSHTDQAFSTILR